MLAPRLHLTAWLGLTALVGACNIDTLTQDFLDKYTRDTDTSSGSSSSSGADTSSSSTSDAPGSGGSQGEAEAESGAGPGSSEPVDTTTGEADTTTGESSTTTGSVAVCGNKIVEADEECDDPGDTRCHKCFRDRLVFVTSEDVYGDFSFDSLKSLDYWCNHLAAVAGLLTNNQARFKTWVSTSEGSAAERLEHGRGRYVLMNGLVFTENWDSLMAGQILNPLNVDENSQTKNIGVFTDTRPDGSAMPGTHCGDWQSDDSNTLIYRGRSSSVDGSWTLYMGEATNPVPCDSPSALYCFESQ
jgi:hypothetical protein